MQDNIRLLELVDKNIYVTYELNDNKYKIIDIYYYSFSNEQKQI